MRCMKQKAKVYTHTHKHTAQSSSPVFFQALFPVFQCISRAAVGAELRSFLKEPSTSINSRDADQSLKNAVWLRLPVSLEPASGSSHKLRVAS